MSDELSTAPAGGLRQGDRVAGGMTVGVLGPVVVLDDCDEVVDRGLGGPKQRLVLSLLMCDAGKVVPVGRLVEGVWGGDADSGSRGSLRPYISRLRGVLDGVATIEHRHGGYVLELAGESDAGRFERLVEDGVDRVSDDPDAATELLLAALEYWRGPPFGDLTQEPGLSESVARLERLQLRALEVLARVEIDRGGADRAIPQLRRLIGEHPTREPLRGLLMLALYRSARQGEALEEYEQVRRTLAEDLGADPSRQLQELHAAILRQDPALDPPPPGSRATADDDPRVVTGTMVGRHRELDHVMGLVGEARAGQSRMVLVSGEGGVGKSRLLRETAKLAGSNGVGVLVGRCMELGGATLPFAPIGQILRRLTRGATDGRLEELLGPAHNELARIVPELGEAPAVGDGAELQGRVFSAVRDALVRHARRRPLLMVVEDVHWADRSTLDLLGVLARSLEQEPIIVAVSFRTDELHRGHPLRGVVGELVRLRHVSRIDLDSLGRDDVAAMIDQITGETPDPAFVDEVLRRSSGNPFYVEELVAAAPGGEPSQLGEGLRDVIMSRLDRLPDGSRRLVEIAAVAGGTVDHQLLAAVSREDPLVLAGRLRPTVDRHVLVAEETRYQFRHDLVREAVVADLLPGELLTLHARIAAALQEHPTLASGGAVAVDAELSHHWHAARDDQRAFDASIRAANQARHSGAHAEAMALDARALELWDAVDHRTAPSLVDVLQTAAETAQLAGRYRRAISLVRRALDETDDPLREANIRCLLALTLAMDARDRSAALAEADRAIETVAGVETSGNIARVLHTVARINLMYGNHSRAVSLGREALDAARAGGDDGTQLDARITVASATAISGPDFKAGIAELQHVLREAHERGAAEATDRAQNNLVVAVSELIDVDSDLVEQTIDQALRWLDEPEQRQDTVAHSWIRNNVAQLALTRGTRKKAEQALGGLQRRHLEGGNLAQFLAARADMRLMRGDLDGAHEDTMRILDLGLDSRGTTDWAFVIAARVAAERSDLEAVRDLVGRQRQLPARDRHEAADLSTPMRLLGVLVRAEVDAALTATAADRIDHLDRVDRAVTQMRTLLEESETRELIATPAQRHDARTLMQLAAAERSRAIAPGEGRWETIVDEALSPRDRVYARLRLAQMQLGAQDRERATKTLNEAHRQASRIGAELLRTQIEQLAASSAISLGSFSDA